MGLNKRQKHHLQIAKDIADSKRGDFPSKASLWGVCTLLRNLHVAIQAHLDEVEWHPIETAPKDRVIELASAPDEKGNLRHIQRAEWWKTFWMGGWLDSRTNRWLFNPSELTHWRERQYTNAPEKKS